VACVSSVILAPSAVVVREPPRPARTSACRSSQSPWRSEPDLSGGPPFHLYGPGVGLSSTSWY